MKVPRDIVTTVISTLVGVVFGTILGVVTSEHFYHRATEDAREGLLDGAMLDIRINVDKGVYPELWDSTAHAEDGLVWRRLSTSGVNTLYAEITCFGGYEHYDEFLKLVHGVKGVLDDYNDRLQLRNSTLLVSLEAIILHNPLAYQFYQAHVLPSITKLWSYIEANRNALVSG